MNGDGTVWADLGVVLLFTKIRVVVWGLLLWLEASNVCSCCLDMCTSFIYLEEEEEGGGGQIHESQSHQCQQEIVHSKILITLVNFS